MYKQAKPVATTSSKGSWLQLMNPVSFLQGGGDKIPESLAALTPDNPELAWMAAKVGAVGLIAAALAGGYRLTHYVADKKSVMDVDNPNKYTARSLDTTITSPLKAGQRKSAALVDWPDKTDVTRNALYVAVPLLAAATGVIGGYKIADNLADNSRQRMIDKGIADKTRRLNALIQARARLPKGTITDAELDEVLAKNANLTKTAKKDRYKDTDTPFMTKLISSLGLLTLAVTGVTAYGAYRKSKANNENNIKYKAVKKGLDAYTREKSSQTPLTVAPEDSRAYFDSIDQGKASNAANVELGSGALKPVSMTI